MELSEIEKKNIVREYILRNAEDIEKGINAIYEMIKSYEDRLEKKYKTKETEKRYKAKIKNLQYRWREKSKKQNEDMVSKNKKIAYLNKKIEELENKQILELQTENKKLEREKAELLLKLKNNRENRDIKDILDGLRNVQIQQI